MIHVSYVYIHIYIYLYLYIYVHDAKDCFWDRSSRGTVLGTKDERLFSETYMLGYVLARKCFSPATSPGRWLVTWIYPISPQTHHGETILILNFKRLWTSLDLWYPKSSTLLVDGVCVCVTKKMRLKLLATIPQKNGWFDLQVFSYLVIYRTTCKLIQVILIITTWNLIVLGCSNHETLITIPCFAINYHVEPPKIGFAKMGSVIGAWFGRERLFLVVKDRFWAWKTVFGRERRTPQKVLKLA